MEIKVLHLCIVFESKSIGAWASNIYYLAQAFRLKNSRFDFLWFAPSKNPNREMIISGYPAREFQMIGPSNAYFFSKQLYDATVKEPASIIHCHGFNNLVTLSGMIAKKPNQKIVLTLNSSKASSKFRELLWIPYVFVFKFLKRRVDHFIPVSEFEMKRFSKLLGVPLDKFTLIPNGTEIELIESINPVKKKGLIVSTGRLVKNKGFDNLIRAFAIVSSERPHARLVIIGDGEERMKLQSLVMSLGLSTKVSFLGYIGQERRKEFLTRLKEAELFVFLSNYESQGMNISEAVTARLPVIVSMNSALAEFVERGEALGVIDPKDHKFVSNLIISVLDNPSFFLPNSVSTISWGKVAEETLKVYEKVLGNKL